MEGGGGDGDATGGAGGGGAAAPAGAGSFSNVVICHDDESELLLVVTPCVDYKIFILANGTVGRVCTLH